MKTEYIDLPTMGDVWKAKEEGWVIEIAAYSHDCNFKAWDGRFWSADMYYRAIKPLPEYYSFEKDDPVICGNTVNEKTKRHFSHIENGKPCCFSNGFTSWTAYNQSDYISCDFCRRPTKEELGE